MAKAKEKMEALVPVEEQPYPVPANWRWMRLDSLKINGNGFFDGDWILSENMNPDGEVRLLQLSDIGIGVFLDKSNKHISKETFDELGCSALHEGDIMISRMAEPIARSCIVPAFPYTVITAVDVAVMRLNASVAYDKYVNHLCNVKWFTDLAYKQARGTTRVRITRKNLGEMPVPIAPIDEQIRIVECIERLFAKLDEAKEKAQAVVDGYEDRKAAILHKAFTGKLTEKWREENNESYDEWIIAPLEKVCTSIYDGDHMPPPKADRGVPFLVISNINKGHLNFDDTRYVPQEYYDGLSDTRKPEFGDVLYTLVGSYGIPVVVDDSRPFCFQRHMALLKPSSIDTYFLWYQLQEHEFYNKATEIATGTAQLTVPIKGLRKLTVKVPQIEEQHKIVSLIDNMISKEEKVKEAAIGIITQIEDMKKSILAKAFRGELGTNDPSEPAIDIN